MKLKLANLEHYQAMADDELRNELIEVQMEYTRACEDMENDQRLQAAIALVESLKMPYTSRKKQLKKLQETLQLVAKMRNM